MVTGLSHSLSHQLDLLYTGSPLILCTTTSHLKMYHWLAGGNCQTQGQPVIFDCVLDLDSFPTSPLEEDNALLWDWWQLATAAGSRDRSVQIQWSLCHVCQQSHRLNKLAKPLPAKCLQALKESWTDSLFACWLCSGSPPLRRQTSLLLLRKKRARTSERRGIEWAASSNKTVRRESGLQVYYSLPGLFCISPE